MRKGFSQKRVNRETYAAITRLSREHLDRVERVVEAHVEACRRLGINPVPELDAFYREALEMVRRGEDLPDSQEMAEKNEIRKLERERRSYDLSEGANYGNVVGKTEVAAIDS